MKRDPPLIEEFLILRSLSSQGPSVRRFLQQEASLPWESMGVRLTGILV